MAKKNKINCIFEIGLHLFDQIDKAFIKYIISLQKQIKLITKKT
jgi:hypothetical protein